MQAVLNFGRNGLYTTLHSNSRWLKWLFIISACWTAETTVHHPCVTLWLRHRTLTADRCRLVTSRSSLYRYCIILHVYELAHYPRNLCVRTLKLELGSIYQLNRRQTHRNLESLVQQCIYTAEMSAPPATPRAGHIHTKHCLARTHHSVYEPWTTP